MITDAELKIVGEFRQGEYTDVMDCAAAINNMIDDDELDLIVGDQSMVEVLAIHARFSQILMDRMTKSFHKQNTTGKMY